jgi:hypothetical protein
MRKKSDYPLQKVTLNLRRGDFDYLQRLHGREGASKAVRSLVIDYIRKAEEHRSLLRYATLDPKP